MRRWSRPVAAASSSLTAVCRTRCSPRSRQGTRSPPGSPATRPSPPTTSSFPRRSQVTPRQTIATSRPRRSTAPRVASSGSSTTTPPAPAPAFAPLLPPRHPCRGSGALATRRARRAATPFSCLSFPFATRRPRSRCSACFRRRGSRSASASASYGRRVRRTSRLTCARWTAARGGVTCARCGSIGGKRAGRAARATSPPPFGPENRFSCRSTRTCASRGTGMPRC
mmetsp:Transcript_8399/g.15186  ORF Transcript_8399/g.15186 Transcript_8399/m.15186 type:complete len:226 (+) Transcript_8399:510-1187(+)